MLHMDMLLMTITDSLSEVYTSSWMTKEPNFRANQCIYPVAYLTSYAAYY